MSVVDPSLSNRDLAPTTPAQRTWTMYNYIALWFSMSHGDHHLPARLLAHRQGHGLEAGRRHGAARQSHRARSHAAQRACRRKVRHSVPGLHSRAVRRARRQHARHSARHRRLRLVRHSVVDRRHRHPRHARRHLARGRKSRRRSLGLLPRLLAAQHGRGLARRRIHPPPAGLWRALHVRHGRCAAHLGPHQGRQLRHHAFHAQPVPLHRRISRRLLSIAHGDGRLLGHAGAQHSRLHPLLEIADRAGLGPGIRTARRHDALHLRRHLRHVGLGRPVRPSHLESDPADRRIPSACGGLHRA